MGDSDAEKISSETRMTWNHNADKHLIGCVVEEMLPGEDTYRSLAARMHALGYTCTPKAVKQHLQKLRRKEGSSAAAGSDSGATTIPSKRKRAAPGSGVKKTPGTGRGKKAAAKTAPLVIDSDDDDDVKESPEKKLKTEAADSKVKEEYDDGLDDYMYPNEI
ncbi:hypothetical protein QBC45DRAFT_392496 [Copromyces sp. CBS 386.78]|nr:hypothetical protein QBC45DRAFT_392496 [Copromyces sp. CBS 386.78]